MTLGAFTDGAHIHDMLIDCDYCISDGRKNNRRYSIITLPANMSA